MAIWTDDAISEMTRLTGLGWSTARVAKALSAQLGLRVTRDMVIGKAHRIGLPLNDQKMMLSEAMRQLHCVAASRATMMKLHAARALAPKRAPDKRVSHKKKTPAAPGVAPGAAPVRRIYKPSGLMLRVWGVIR